MGRALSASMDQMQQLHREGLDGDERALREVAG